MSAELPNGNYADIPGVRLYYSDTGGTGEPIVLLHATTGTSVSWEPQIEAFSKAGYRTIAPDRRGWGRSTLDPQTGPREVTGADDLDAFLEHMKLPPFHLVAVAGGGLIALDYASWRTDRLRSLVIGSCIGSRKEKELVDFSARIAAPADVKLPRVFQDVGASYRGANAEGTARWIEISRSARQPGAPALGLRSGNTYADLAKIGVPTLVLAGGADLVAPPAMMRTWAARIPKAQFDIVVEAGHSIAWEQPEAFNRKVLAFLARLPR